MAVKSSSGGMTPASESLLALTKIMNRIVVLLCFGSRDSDDRNSGSTVTPNGPRRNRHVETNFFLLMLLSDRYRPVSGWLDPEGRLRVWRCALSADRSLPAPSGPWP